jgi:hypothetical protein
MNPHYYNADEFAMNFGGRSVSFAKFPLRLLARQARNFQEFVVYDLGWISTWSSQ